MASLTTYWTTASSICEEMHVEAVLKTKRLRTSKSHFSHETPDEAVIDAPKKLLVLTIVVDSAMTSVDERFQTLNEVKTKYGVLLDFSNSS